MGNLAARSSTVIIIKISFMTYDVHLQFTLLSEHAAIRWLLMRALQKQLQFLLRWFRYGLSWSFLWSTSQYYTYQYFLSQMRETSPGYDRDFRKRPGDFRRFLIFQRLPNFAETVRRCSEDVWALPKLLTRWQL